jgi:hypothetical protein
VVKAVVTASKVKFESVLTVLLEVGSTNPGYQVRDVTPRTEPFVAFAVRMELPFRNQQSPHSTPWAKNARTATPDFQWDSFEVRILYLL